MVTDDLPDSFEQLVAFGQRPDVKIRPVLLRVLVDMFVGKTHHRPSDLAQFEEMMVHLLDDADDETRLVVAEKLSMNAATPPSLLNRFLAERGEIAARVLSHAPMNERSLNAAAVFGTVGMAQAVAGRPDLDRGVVRSLAERPEPAVLLALAGNRSAPIDRSVFRYLTHRARDLPALASVLIERGGTSSETPSLFLSADRARRSDMIAEARRQDLGAGIRRSPATPGPDILASIERASHVPGLEGLDAALAVALDLPASHIERLMDDRHGEPLALALAALGLSPEIAARIFILGDPTVGYSYDRVKTLVGIVETVPAPAAHRLVMAMLGQVSETPRRAVASPAAESGGRHVEAATRTAAPLAAPLKQTARGR